ncbi:MAG TPA: P1 family peptidase [Clostridia bacterium]|nr:P1 family peptidase [Clostridia bacterium]
MEKTIPKGIKIGHAADEFTGVTVIVCEEGCVGGADIRGGAPGTHETDLLRNEKVMQKINGIALLGGSAYGLGAIAGIMECLRKKGIGYKVQGKVVPIIPGAVIFDLNDNKYHYPDFEMGYRAVENASEDNIVSGKVGAGTGATVGKVRGIKNAMSGGLGIASLKVQGITLTAVVVVNALGDIYNHNNEIIAGALDNKGNFLNTEKTILDGDFIRLVMGTNTTIGCIITDAKLTKVEANKLASISHNGLAKSIRPVHTDYDGDTIFCMATGKKKALNFMLLEVGAIEAIQLAIEDAVKR